jgi:hypothetical protein
MPWISSLTFSLSWPFPISLFVDFLRLHDSHARRESNSVLTTEAQLVGGRSSPCAHCFIEMASHRQEHSPEGSRRRDASDLTRRNRWRQIRSAKKLAEFSCYTERLASILRFSTSAVDQVVVFGSDALSLQ